MEEVNFDMVSSDNEGLPKVYNTFITEEVASRHDIVAFVHDDVYIDDLRLQQKLYTATRVNGFDLVGLAGCKDPIIKDPALWHLMADRSNLRGCVAHPYNAAKTKYNALSPNFDYPIAYTHFGETPDRVTLLDGLFIAVNLQSALRVGWKFNEEFKYHHYDIASCIDANRKQLKLGVYPINVIHSSPGLLSMEDKNWKQSNEKFLKMYNT